MYDQRTRFHFQRFPDFGKELKRPFAVHELCYDCAAFYDGCPAWPAAKKITCRHFQPLPDVMPGTYGQEFPENVFVPENPTGEKRPVEQPQLTPARPAPSEPKPKATDRKAKDPRRCKCGELLAKGKQYCDECRQQIRGETKREYMRNHMHERRTGRSRL